MAHKSLTSILLGTGSALALAASAHAGALPSGGHFVSGKGEIGKVGQSLTVRQSSTTGIINWSSFSVGKNRGVTFDNGSGATLNRVTGGNLSRIAGSLHATGSLYLMNTAGVIVSGTGRVVTGGSFVATSGNLPNSAFGDGRRWIGNAKARVVNHGSITAGGEAKLVGSGVANTGTITAAHVKLRATDGEALAGGTLRATGSANRDAHILVISDNGLTKVTGALAARNNNGSGGEIETSGHRVSIGGSIDAGKGGTWLVDPENLTVDAAAATTIHSSLNSGTNVTLETGATGASGPGIISNGDGDIKIAAPLRWRSAATLTLNSYHSILIDSAVNINGAGDVIVLTNDGGSGGDYMFDGGHFAFTDVNGGVVSGGLVVNGKTFQLEGTLNALREAIARDKNGDFALAHSINLKVQYAWSPIKSLDGIFDGLGNDVSNLTIDIPFHGRNSSDNGLFGGLGGIIRDINIENGNITGGVNVGGLVGFNAGQVLYSSFSGNVTGDSESLFVGGLVGWNAGIETSLVYGSHSSGTVSSTAASVGGLVGDDRAVIENSSSSSDVFSAGGWAGGLLGEAETGNLQIINSFATGTVTVSDEGGAGGLIGDNETSLVIHCYATGNVVGGNGDALGGLVGGDLYGATTAGRIFDSYATGNVTGGSGSIAGGLAGENSGVVKESYSTGNVKVGAPSIVGGLVGLAAVDIRDSFATGSVTVNGTSNTAVSAVGGLAGLFASGILGDDYATGHVTAEAGSYIGGVVGYDEEIGDCCFDVGVAHVYWDRKTTGVESTAQGAGNAANVRGLHGVWDSTLKAKLPRGFKPSIWAIDPSINNGLPYLIALKSSY